MPFVADPVAPSAPPAPSGFVPDAVAQPEPNMLNANRAFARAAAGSIGDQMVDGVRLGFENFAAPFEAAANAASGLILGFPAHVGAALSGLAQKHLLGIDVDPKELADTIGEIATYKPMTKGGQALSSQLMWPLEKIAEGASAAGHAVTDSLASSAAEGERHRAKYGIPVWQQTQPDASARRAADVEFAEKAAPAAGAITDSAIQMLGPMLIGELGRKMGGQHVTSDDMDNVAKVVAGPEASPEAVAATGASLRAVYDKTGIGPFTLAEAAAKDPELRAQLADPAIEVPTALEQYVEKTPAAEPSSKVVSPDGQPLTVYHGTDQEFSSFEGGMFTSNRGRAENYAMGSAGRVIEANLDIRNPMPWAEAFGKTPEEIKAAGYDGAIQWDDNGHVLRAVVTDPSQVNDVANPAAVPEDQHAPVETLPAASERADDLRAMGRAAYWSEEGGKLLRAPLEDGEGPVGRVTGRTAWIPAEEWFGEMRRALGKNGLTTQTGIQAAIEKAIAGERLTPKQQRTVDYIRQETELMRARVGRYAPDAEGLAEDMAGSGLSAVDVPDVAMIRRAALADPVAFEKAADEAFDRAEKTPDYVSHEDADFHDAIRAILATEDANRGHDPGGAQEPGALAGEPGGGSAGGAEPGAAGGNQSPARRPGAGQLNSGLDPAAVLDAVRGTVKDLKDAADGVVNSEIGREVVKTVMPMSAGTRPAQAAAQKFANAMRNARFQWQRIGSFLERTFTPEERKAMWNAADEENVLRMNGEDTAGKGLDTLPAKQRSVMTELHELANGLWARAKAAGMVEGEGLPFWTPRMAVLVGEDGEFMRPGGGDTRTTSKGEGSNVKTTASSLKQRKHLTSEETEAAMKQSLGDNAQLVRDILTMPLAMSRMSQAIAGRELISQLKELGQVSGDEIVSEGVRPGFTTIDHPAFTTYRPEFVTGVDGKVAPRLDEDGQPVMQRTPLLINEDWAGPLKAVLSTKDGAIYSALMLAKSKAMAAIMISPAAHNMVIFGRALAYDPAAVFSLRAYFAGHALAKDAALMTRGIGHGMVPIGANKSSMMDITDVARTIGKDGGWGDPNQSWINLSVRAVGNVFKDGLGDALKQRMDAFGDFWHHTLLWKQVGALQTYIYNDYYNHLTELGHPDGVAGPIAANLANRYSGAVAAENSSEMVRKALNVLLFSRSFNVGNIGAVHDAAFGLPAGLRAKMFVDAGEEAAAKGGAAAAGKARMGLVTDLGMSMLMTAAASAAVAKLLMHQTTDDIANGYGRRLSDMLGNIKDHPLNPGSYNPYRILPTWENEAGKQDRIDLGAQPGGRHEYLRLPTGKVVEDTVGWLLHSPDTFVKKLSPLARASWEAVSNDKGFGVPVEDPEGNTLKHIAQGLQHVIAAQVPMDALKTLYDVTTGVGTPLDKDKLAGFASGFSTSQGNPSGPAEGAYYAQQDRVSAMKKYQMEAVRDDLKHGREAEAFDRLKAIGLPPREIASTIRNIKTPHQGMTRQQTRRFVAEATDQDRAALDNARRQISTTE